MLTTLVGFIAVLSSWTAVEDRVKSYYAMAGCSRRHDRRVRVARLPVVLRVLGSGAGADVLPDRRVGGPRKLYAAIKFFLYTLAGSVLMLLGILTLYFHHFAQYASTRSTSRN